MKNDIERFKNEITDKFSELFVETFFLRYFSEFDINELLENVSDIMELLNKKMNKQFKIKLKNNGFNEKDIKKFIK